MRYKLLRFIRELSGISEGGMSPKPIMILYHILFPLNWFYQKQSNIHYSPMSNIYTIQGQKFSGDIFDFFSRCAERGECFQMIKENGEVMLKKIYAGEPYVKK